MITEHPEIDEARLILAAVAMHGLLSSPQMYEIKSIIHDSVKLADGLLKKLEEKTP